MWCSLIYTLILRALSKRVSSVYPTSPWSLEYPRESIIYLTADAEETLEFPLSTEMVYIIGALVDRNRCKGVTLRKAQKEGVKVAKLPLRKDQIAGSKVLTGE